MPGKQNHEEVRRRVRLTHAELGGECVVCGSKERLEFHHKNPDDKLYEMYALHRNSTYKTQIFYDELAKCELRCFACHRRVPEHRICRHGVYVIHCDACKRAKKLHSDRIAEMINAALSPDG